jgi:hypothetical protein
MWPCPAVWSMSLPRSIGYRLACTALASCRIMPKASPAIVSAVSALIERFGREDQMAFHGSSNSMIPRRTYPQDNFKGPYFGVIFLLMRLAPTSYSWTRRFDYTLAFKILHESYQLRT